MATKVTSFEIASRELQPILNFIKDEKKAGKNIKLMDFLKKDEFKNSPFRTRMKEIVKFLEDNNFTKDRINKSFPLQEIEARAAKKDGNKLGKKKAAAQDKSTKVPKREATKAPTRKPTKTPTREATKAAARTATKAPVKKATKAPSRKATKVPARKPSTPVRNLVKPTAKGAAGEQGMLDFTPKTTTNLPEEDDLGRSIRKSKEAANKPPVKGAAGRQMTFGFADDAARTAGRTAGSAAARAAGGLGLRGLGALAGGVPGMALLALSLIPMLGGSVVQSRRNRKEAVDLARYKARMQRNQIEQMTRTPSDDMLRDQTYLGRLQSNYNSAANPSSRGAVSPELQALIGGSQGELSAIAGQEALGGRLGLSEVMSRLEQRRGTG